MPGSLHVSRPAVPRWRDAGLPRQERPSRVERPHGPGPAPGSWWGRAVCGGAGAAGGVAGTWGAGRFCGNRIGRGGGLGRGGPGRPARGCTTAAGRRADPPQIQVGAAGEWQGKGSDSRGSDSEATEQLPRVAVCQQDARRSEWFSTELWSVPPMRDAGAITGLPRGAPPKDSPRKPCDLTVSRVGCNGAAFTVLLPHMLSRCCTGVQAIPKDGARWVSISSRRWVTRASALSRGGPPHERPLLYFDPTIDFEDASTLHSVRVPTLRCRLPPDFSRRGGGGKPVVRFSRFSSANAVAETSQLVHNVGDCSGKALYVEQRGLLNRGTGIITSSRPGDSVSQLRGNAEPGKGCIPHGGVRGFCSLHIWGVT